MCGFVVGGIVVFVGVLGFSKAVIFGVFFWAKKKGFRLYSKSRSFVMLTYCVRV